MKKSFLPSSILQLQWHLLHAQKKKWRKIFFSKDITGDIFMTWYILQFKYPKRISKWNMNYQLKSRNKWNTTKVGYIFYEDEEYFLYLRSFPTGLLQFINKIIRLIVYFYWKPFTPPIPSNGASLVAQRQRIRLQSRRPRFNPWIRKIPWRRKLQPTPVF